MTLLLQFNALTQYSTLNLIEEEEEDERSSNWNATEIYLFKVNKGTQIQWPGSGVFIFNIELISQIILVLPLLILSN